MPGQLAEFLKYNSIMEVFLNMDYYYLSDSFISPLVLNLSRIKRCIHKCFIPNNVGISSHIIF